MDAASRLQMRLLASQIKSPDTFFQIDADHRLLGKWISPSHTYSYVLLARVAPNPTDSQGCDGCFLHRHLYFYGQNQPEPRMSCPTKLLSAGLTGVFELIVARYLLNSQGLGPCMSPNHIKVIWLGSIYGPEPYEFIGSRTTITPHMPL